MPRPALNWSLYSWNICEATTSGIGEVNFVPKRMEVGYKTPFSLVFSYVAGLLSVELVNGVRNVVVGFQSGWWMV